ncbi:MAG: polysaccharide deacetylase family protein [Gemmatimonadaceae bacterium]|nr:polysaccharide deacetylase family protein [Chitinophagaceae bacterium]
MYYLVKTPWLFRKLVYPAYRWKMPADEKKIYLSFDDGPHPTITSFVLDELRKYNARATFFCIGKNVAEQTDMYKRILNEGHAVGNHTHNHLNGWKVGDAPYFENIALAAKYIDSRLFRPPYGRITAFQAKQLKEKWDMTTVMWSVLSGDFDQDLSPEKCWKNVRDSISAGSIVVFHDSEKAYERLGYALPRVLDHFSHKGFSFEKIS